MTRARSPGGPGSSPFLPLPRNRPVGCRREVDPVDRYDAFRRLYQNHYGKMAAYARRRLDWNDADDAVAEIFLIAWRRLEDIPPGGHALLWLYGVARRVVSEDRRSGRRRNRLMAKLSEAGGMQESTESETERSDDRLAVRSALATLRPKDRELLRLAEWEELTTAQLAEVFGCSQNAIAIRLHRAHRRFGQALQSVDGELRPTEQPEASR